MVICESMPSLSAGMSLFAVLQLKPSMPGRFFSPANNWGLAWTEPATGTSVPGGEAAGPVHADRAAKANSKNALRMLYPTIAQLSG